MISTEVNCVVATRCNNLGIEYLQGIDNKLTALSQWLGIKKVDLQDVIYVGNDINDTACLKAVGCSVVVADAHPDVKNEAKIILSSKGGEGALRELANLLHIKMWGESHGK